VVQTFAESAREDGRELSANEAQGRGAVSASLSVDAIGEGQLHVVAPPFTELGGEGEKR
jgi:hypothetical protein